MSIDYQMNTLNFDIMPSPLSNDHQVRILIDGVDLLGENYLGLDPPHFFGQRSLTSEGKLLVGRCECGCVGCHDIQVDVTRIDREVLWTNVDDGVRLTFNREEYGRLISEATGDFSWEDAKRSAERLVQGVFAGDSTDDGYIFDWASARVRDGIITLSFNRDGDQKLFEFDWDGCSPDDALANAKRFYKEKHGLPHFP